MSLKKTQSYSVSLNWLCISVLRSISMLNFQFYFKKGIYIPQYQILLSPTIKKIATVPFGEGSHIGRFDKTGNYLKK